MGKWTALAEKTFKDMQKRKEERKKGKLDAKNHIIENTIRVNKRLRRF